jgi:hypothetical protein
MFPDVPINPRGNGYRINAAMKLVTVCRIIGHNLLRRELDQCIKHML